MRRTIVDAQVINELLTRCPTTTVDPLDTLVHEGDVCESLMVDVGVMKNFFITIKEYNCPEKVAIRSKVMQ